MVLQRGDKQPQSVEKTPDKNAKRREIYSQKIAADKNTLLSQRRLKDRESTSHRLLQNSASKKLMQSAISSYIPPVVGSTTQTRPTLRASSSLSQTLNEHRVFPSLPAPGGTTDAALPISVFEKGESSSISNKKGAPACEPPVTEAARVCRKKLHFPLDNLQQRACF